MTQQRILHPGRNCWRIEHARRAAFLIDGEAYFSAFRDAAANARDNIIILGWDIHSEVRLIRNSHNDRLPNTLYAFLNALASRRRNLHIHVLVWDFAMIYALEREWLPVYKLDWRSHRRLNFCMDDKHPLGASHHQKIVVIDDAVAFAGGFDLSKWRWDTTQHHADDPRRTGPDGGAYPPFHDIQMMVDGDAAAALGELARRRWFHATGQRLHSPDAGNHDPWPQYLTPDITDVDIAIARTQPAYGNATEVREIEQLYIDAIDAARRHIYIENQYITSKSIGDALVRRLGEDNGPEVVLVLPEKTSGWLEQATMDVLRGRLLQRLREADRHQRLRVYYPVTSRKSGEPVSINVHSKILIIDDALLRIGSANASNRSMGLDTECDLAVEARNNSALNEAIAGLRHRLLGEHLDMEPGEVGRRCTDTGSLIATVEALRKDKGRTLRPLHGEVPAFLDRQVPDAAVIDPEQAVNPDYFADHVLPKEQQAHAGHRGLRLALMLLSLVTLAALWRWTPLSELADTGTLQNAISRIQHIPLAPLMVLGGFVLGGLIAFPVTVLIIVTGALFGPLFGFIYALLGSILSAMLTYGLGSMLGREAIRRLSGSHVNRLSQRLADRGVLAIITVRIIPVAPFTIINMVAGASHIRFQDYMIGTTIGMIPGTLVLTTFIDQLWEAVQQPNWVSFSLVVIIIMAVAASVLVFNRRSKNRHHDDTARQDTGTHE